MRRKTSLITIITALLIVSFAPYTCLAYSGGTGSTGNPYKIANVADFNQLSSTPTHWNKAFILTADINLTGLIFIQAPIAPDTSTSSGFQGTQFTGVFDGNNHTISNLTITTSTKYYIGLFGYVGSGGQIRNLGVKNVNITGDEYVGGLVGYNSYGTLTDCYSTGSVTGTGSNVGGLVGRNYGSLTSCYTTGSVTGTGSNVGGLVGENDGTITDCYATGSVTGTGSNVGGLVGYSSGLLTACFWNMETSGQSGSAGGKGLTTSQMKSIAIYQNAGWADKGWVINDGLDSPRLSWEGTVGVPIPQPQPVPLLGSGSEQDPYQIWTADDFVLLSWHIGILDKHIALMTNLDLSGVVLYPIGDLGPFTGVFDGDGYAISNLTINTPTDYIGLFGYVGSGGQIRNLGVEDVNITGDETIGGLVGSNYGSLIACYATGSVSGAGGIGGLVGYNGGSLTDCYATGSVNGRAFDIGGLVGFNYGSLTDCYATGSVSGYSYVGGLVGENSSGSLTDCYATGSVTGTGDEVGGLVGENWYDSIIHNCYFLTTSGPNNGFGRPRTGTQMKQQASFVGWDFAGETANGTKDYWRMCMDGVDYPRLTWEFTEHGDLVCPDGVDIEDLAELCRQWLFKVIPADLAPFGGDGIVDFKDFAVFAKQWGVTNGIDELLDFTEQWLQTGLPICSADISSDGRVNEVDFAIMANHWHEGL